MRCEYCGTEEQTGKICTRCGGKLPEKKPDIWKSEPFFYNGYICYALRDPLRDTYEVQFWLGRELIERICMTKDFLLERVPEYCDAMPFFWDLFLVSHGEKEVLEWQEKNNKYPATFLVTRVENPEKQRLRELSIEELARECRVTG